ncbi:MAG: hypothetical protein M3131_08575 [Actinomycetota bacterium]|nr:hypothetical protein [Actinomycetota bacterium]
MKIAVARVPRRARRRAAFASVLLLSAVIAAALPAGGAAEEASQPSAPEAAQLDAGRNHSCAMVAGGSVRCWGYSGEGELGYGDTRTIGDDETPGAAGPIDLGAGGTAASISAGHFHTCAQLDADGSVRCWGFGGDGRLGYRGEGNIGDNETPALAGPVNIGAGRRAVAVSAGGSHTCALLDGRGDMRCWGYGFYGALGYGGNPNHQNGELHPPDIGDNEFPGDQPAVSFGSGRTAVAISAGGYHTCALLDGGEVRCWGYAGNGQLGYGKPPDAENPPNLADPEAVGAVDLGPGRTAVAISAGEVHTCALLDDGSVRCWGFGGNGRLGLGNTASIGDDELPGSVAPALGPGTAVAISAGDSHTCALLRGGAVRCWGFGAGGQLGYGNTNNIGDNEAPDQAGPVDLGPDRTALAVSAGGRHTCARLDGGAVSVSCWGHGGNGRLGYCNERDVGDDERMHLGDAQDHALRVVEQADGLRQLLQNILNVNLTLETKALNEASNAQNEDVKMISAWAAILYAPTLVGTVYGMNFDGMPELRWRFGYAYALLLMLATSLTLYVVFKRRRWI